MNEDAKLKEIERFKIETMSASVVDELRLNNYSAKLLLDYITNLQKENEDYKSRIDKAREYIKNLKNYRFEFGFDAVDRHKIVGCTENFVKELLKILGGDSNE